MNRTVVSFVVLLLSSGLTHSPSRAEEALFHLLQERQCRGCRLADADLVHADLRDADLSDSKLMRANLSQARLDGADLRNADLSFTSLRGASLRGTNLKGAKFYGTDLRDCDLTGALLDANALEESHWEGAKGLSPHIQSHSSLHNAGVRAAEEDHWKQAEDLFSKAIRNQPSTAESWVARAIAREKQGKRQLAIQDFNYASTLFKAQGNINHAKQLEAAAISLQDKAYTNQTGNGVGSAVLSGLITTSQAVLPIAMKLFMPAIGF